MAGSLFPLPPFLGGYQVKLGLDGLIASCILVQFITESSELAQRTMSPSPFRTMIPVFVACLIGLAVAGKAAAQTQDPWVLRASGTVQALNGMTYGSGLYVVVGDGGAIVSSPDAVTWTPRNSGTTWALRSVCFGANQFVATGANGVILTSPDGIAWTARPSGTGLLLSGVAYGAGKYVAVGAFGTAVVSEDGITWAEADLVTGSFLQGVTFGDGRFLAYGQEEYMEDGELHGTLRASEDGAEWITVTMPVSGDVYAAAHFRGRHYTGGIFGETFSSADLILWRQENLGTFSSVRALATDGNTLVAVCQDGAIRASTDGVAWSVARPAGGSALFGLGFAEGNFVAVGDVTAGSGTILTSPQDPVVTAYGAWKSLHFSEAEQADPAISGPTVDVEPDGIPNIAEFAHGLDPKISNSGSDRLLALRHSQANGNTELQWTYDQTASAEVSMVIRYSDTLAPESWQTLEVTPENLGSDGDLQTVLFVDEAPSATRRFYRAEYTLTE